MASNTLVAVWENQARWSAVANQLKKGIVRARTGALVLGILGAVLATWASQDRSHSSAGGGAATTGHRTQPTNALAPSEGLGRPLANSSQGLSRVLSGLSVITLAFAAALTKRSGTSQVQNWISARSISEALKEELFLYLTHVGPYAGNSSESPEDTLDGRQTEIVAKAKVDLKVLAASTTPQTKDIPSFSSDDDYIIKRVNHQINEYYEPNASRLSKRLKFFQGAATTLIASAAAISGAVAYFQTEWFGAWVAVATTISAALSAHIGAARYQHDSIVFYSTAQQLKSLRDRYKDAKDAAAKDPAKSAPSFEKFVHQCEEVISIESQGWMANWQKPGGPPPPLNS